VINFAEFLLIKFKKHFEKVQSTLSELSGHPPSLSFSFTSLLFSFRYLETSFQLQSTTKYRNVRGGIFTEMARRKVVCTCAPFARACVRLRCAPARLPAHDMQTCTRKCSSLSLSRCYTFLPAAENIMMASERSCERSFVRPSVRPFVWDSCWKPAIRRECLLPP